MTDPDTLSALDRVAVPPSVELVARTRQAEARAAVATAAGLFEHGVPPSDVAITTADVDRYEDALRRAANRYGVTVAVWTPLRLERTVPYRFVASTLAALAQLEAGSVAVDALAEPLRLGWVPPSDDRGPISAAAVDAVTRRHPDADHPVDEWLPRVAASDLGPGQTSHWVAYLNWLDAQPRSPSPDDVLDTLRPAMAAFDDAVLPDRLTDEPVSDVAETVRGFDRTDELLRMVRKRYGKWLSAGRTAREWDAVAELLDAFATTLPGRRELPTAAAVDVKEANDVWALDVPYVIAVGLVDSEWPRSTATAVPGGVRTAVARTDGRGIDAVRPHSTWTDARDRDHFASAVDAASTLFVATRHVEDPDGVERRPSRFLADLDTTLPDDESVERLVENPAALPEPIADPLADCGDTNRLDPATDE